MNKKERILHFNNAFKNIKKIINSSEIFFIFLLKDTLNSIFLLKIFFL